MEETIVSSYLQCKGKPNSLGCVECTLQCSRKTSLYKNTLCVLDQKRVERVGSRHKECFDTFPGNMTIAHVQIKHKYSDNYSPNRQK